MPDSQLLVVALPTASTIIVVLIGILLNNARLSDLRADMNTRFDEVDRRFNEFDRRFTEFDRKFDQRFDDIKETWRAELHRVEEVLDARLRHLEER